MAVADTPKPSAAPAIAALRGRRVKGEPVEFVMLTGDHERTAQAIARRVGITRVVAGVLPAGKVEAIRRLQEEAGPVAMVGDGINDAAALAQADVGIALGAGTDVAIEAADVTLVRADLSALPAAVLLSEAVYGKVVQNLAWALGYNLVTVPLAMLGLLHPLVAETAMALSSIAVVGNSLRLRRVRIFDADRAGSQERVPRS
jgi:Cu+-exporting ATPase